MLVAEAEEEELEAEEEQEKRNHLAFKPIEKEMLSVVQSGVEHVNGSGGHSSGGG